MRIKEVLMFLLCFSLAGCATVGKEIQADSLNKIHKGITTEKEVISLLGNPQTKTIGSDGKIIMLYQYTKVKNRTVNFIPVVGLLAGGMDMRTQMLTILIGENDKVDNFTLNDANTDINSGLFNTK